MKARIGRQVVVYSLLFMCACSGGKTSGGSGGGGGPNPSSKEILYAANSANAIFAFSIDQSSGALTETASVNPGGNSFGETDIALTPSGSFLYAANNGLSEVNVYATSSSGTLSVTAGSPFSVQGATTGLAAFTVHPSGQFLYVSNRSGFGVTGFSIDSVTGNLSQIPGGPFQCPGVGGPPEKIAIDPSGRFLYASASFDDVFLPSGFNIWAFTINAQTGVLTPVPGAPFATLGGSQPQGIRVDPSGKYVYVALSNSDSIYGFGIDSSSGALTSVPGSPFPTASTQFTQTYDLTIAPSGKFLYAFNFNGNTIAAFTISSSNGSLTTVVGSPFAANPMGEGSIIVDPSEKFLYLTIGFAPPYAFDIFNINPSTGALAPNPLSPVGGSEEAMGLAVARFQ